MHLSSDFAANGRRVQAVVALMLMSLFMSTEAGAAPLNRLNAGEVGRAIERLSVVGRVLYVAAHPDDENTRFLAWARNEKLMRAAYLSLTRGEGGQNLIGNELSPLLGIIRTQELLAARSVDGAEQLFTRARDFGYSKSPEETLGIWDKDAILADVVWNIRRFKPDVIVTRFAPDGKDTHGHHTASAQLALQAFKLAADPNFHAEQLKYTQPWQAKRILWNRVSSKTRAGMPCLGCTEPEFPFFDLAPGTVFKTQTVMGVPKDLPLGVDRTGYIKLTAAAKGAVPAWAETDIFVV
jgi:LmbE family N-acetylglucosaminyl deacetylase